GSPLKIDRKTADTIFVPHPVICVVGGVQPEMLGALADEAGRRDGFIERILWSYPDTSPARWSDLIVPDATRTAVVELFRRLRLHERCLPLTLDPAAKAAFVKWHDMNAHRQEGSKGLAQGVCAKLPMHAGRLALVLRALADPDARELDRPTMEAAIELTEYFRGHADRVI